MPVFDFKNASKESSFECTYTTFSSDNKTASPEHPIFVLDNSEHNWAAETIGMFANPYKKTAFEFQTDDGNILSNIIKVDARFTSLIKWLGENRIKVKLSGKNVEDGYAVYRIREIAFNNSQKLSSEDGFLQYMIERLLDSSIVAQDIPDDELDESGDSMMLNIQWKSNYFESIDPVEARRILDEELFGMESVKQRIIETVIQINRTHTLPSYGILLVGPAGTGKSQIAYLVAKILKMPWTTLDMSSINDAEQLTGSSRIYSNAKPGIIMEAFNNAGESNLVFIINELDKATSSNGNANPADVLLTLLDNLGFTDNYMECLIPTSGVYPIATANYKEQISAPLLSRFAVIDIPDYSREEKKTIFKQFSLPKVLKKIGLHENECTILDEGLDVVLDIFKDTTGIRDLEQAAEHLAAHALYLIEVDHVKEVVYNADMVKELFSTHH